MVSPAKGKGSSPAPTNSIAMKKMNTVAWDEEYEQPIPMSSSTARSTEKKSEKLPWEQKALEIETKVLLRT